MRLDIDNHLQRIQQKLHSRNIHLKQETGSQPNPLNCRRQIMVAKDIPQIIVETKQGSEQSRCLEVINRSSIFLAWWLPLQISDSQKFPWPPNICSLLLFSLHPYCREPHAVITFSVLSYKIFVSHSPKSWRKIFNRSGPIIIHGRTFTFIAVDAKLCNLAFFFFSSAYCECAHMLYK